MRVIQFRIQYILTDGEEGSMLVGIARHWILNRKSTPAAGAGFVEAIEAFGARPVVVRHAMLQDIWC